ncbi:MAG: alcohol dehydrogenase, partial [Chloroflexota bacterium]|nr:alcohol dehydrogenase [Chloroflexota bacterium]
CGGVGLSAVMIAVAAGAQVVAIDVSEAALHAAVELGATATINASAVEGGDVPTDVAERIRAATGGGAHLSIDALGSATTSLNSIAGLRKRGRHVQVGLMLGADSRAPMPMDLIVARELEVLGSHGMAAHDYAAMLAGIAEGRLDPSRLVGRTISLDEAPAALMAMDFPQAVTGITVIVPGAV